MMTFFFFSQCSYHLFSSLIYELKVPFCVLDSQLYILNSGGLLSFAWVPHPCSMA